LSFFLFKFRYRCPQRSVFSLLNRTTAARLALNEQGLGAGGASTAARTGAKLANSYKLSGEPLPRLRQTQVSSSSISRTFSFHFNRKFFHSVFHTFDYDFTVLFRVVGGQSQIMA